MTAEALFWDRGSDARQCRTVSSVAEVEALATSLLAQYSAADGIAVGIELRRGAADLSVAVSNSGWALIHTDDDFNQRRTRASDDEDRGTVDVLWEEATSIPRTWFISKELALLGVGRWLADGGLAPEIDWSDDCS